MKKKIIAISLLSGILGFSNLATAAWESSWSGQVRINMTQSNGNASTGNGGAHSTDQNDDDAKSDTAWKTATDVADDSYLSWNNNNADLGVKTSIRFAVDGEVRYTISYGKEADGWSVASKLEWDNNLGLAGATTDYRDAWVSAKNASGMMFKVGRFIALQGGIYHAAAANTLGVGGDLDALYDDAGRVNAIQAGYSANGVDASLALVMDSSKGMSNANGNDYSTGLKTDGSTLLSNADALYNNEAKIFNVSYTGMEDLVVNFNYSVATSKTTKDRLAANSSASETVTVAGVASAVTNAVLEKSERTSNSMLLATSYDLGMAKVIFNYNTASNQNRAGLGAVEVKSDYSINVMSLGADVALGDDTITFAVGKSASNNAHNVDVGTLNAAGKIETLNKKAIEVKSSSVGAYIDLGYKTSIAGIATTAVYSTKNVVTSTDTEGSNDEDTKSTDKLMGFRFQYSF